MINLLRALALLLCFLSSLQAQPSEEEIINVEVIALSGSEFPEFHYITPAGDHSPLPVGIAARSKSFQWKRANTFPLYKKVPTADFGESMQKVAEIAIPPAEGDLLILFYINKQGSLRNKIVAKSPRLHLAGSARMINLTGDTVGYLLNETTYRIAPDEETIIELNVSANERFRFAFQLLAPDNTHPRSSIKTLRLLNEQMRFMAIYAYQIVTTQENGKDSTKLEPYAFRIYDYTNNN